MSWTERIEQAALNLLVDLGNRPDSLMLDNPRKLVKVLRKNLPAEPNQLHPDSQAAAEAATADEAKQSQAARTWLKLKPQHQQNLLTAVEQLKGDPDWMREGLEQYRLLKPLPQESAISE